MQVYLILTFLQTAHGKIGAPGLHVPRVVVQVQRLIQDLNLGHYMVERIALGLNQNQPVAKYRLSLIVNGTIGRHGHPVQVHVVVAPKIVPGQNLGHLVVECHAQGLHQNQ